MITSPANNHPIPPGLAAASGQRSPRTRPHTSEVPWWSTATDLPCMEIPSIMEHLDITDITSKSMGYVGQLGGEG